MPTPPLMVAPKAADYAVICRKVFERGEDFWVLLMSDLHWDSPETQLWLLKQHLDQAKERNAIVIDIGDMLDVMGSRWDKRGTHGSVRPEHSKHDYLDSLVDSCADWLKPYREQIKVVGTGNHEAKIVKVVGTDLTRRVVDRLNSDGGEIIRTGYEFWVRFMFTTSSGCKRGFRLKCSHGFGGSSPVTKGTINAQRMGADIDGADIIATGHIHQKWTLPGVVETLEDNTSRVILRERIHVQLGSYKCDFRTDGAPTWHMQGNRQPKPLGGCWLHFRPAQGDRTIIVTPVATEVDYSRLRMAS